jgi:AGZA family xanthine/uracil permease-like MFS transporter
VAGGVGLFIAFIGLKEAGIIVANPATTVALGDLTKPDRRAGDPGPGWSSRC